MKRLIVALLLLVPSAAMAQNVVDVLYRPISPTTFQGISTTALTITHSIVSRAVRVVCTAACNFSFRVSGSTQGLASLTSGIYLPANTIDYLNITPQSTISVIGTAGGTIFVTELGH